MSEKPTNPKDSCSIKKWRQFTCVPFPPIWELGAAMLEGARKYGRHNYRYAGVLASVYVDAAIGHITQWWEGEDIDPDSGLSHITKAIATLVVMRDGMLCGNFNDDRPPKCPLNEIRDRLQEVVEGLVEKYPTPPTEPAHEIEKLPVSCVHNTGTRKGK